MQAFSECLQESLRSLPLRPISKETFDSLVEKAISDSEGKAASENRRATWEFVLKNEIFDFAITEGQALKDPRTTYYDDLKDRLDIALAFTEHDACEQIFLFTTLYDLLETQTIASCSHIFSWIEERADRLTQELIPQKGKALLLLRMLNDLLRRLSKIGGTTKFCGRILIFLSRVFPLGERSGVNLRGVYGPTWDGPGLKGDEGSRSEKKSDTLGGDKMDVDEGDKIPASLQAQEAAEDFYHTFWSLQLPFSRPALFSDPQALPQFQESVNKVLPVIKEATVKERALMGSKSSTSNGTTSLKRKRDPENITEMAGREYFFAKYLTSPDLLELEVADTHFRRQFLFQLLILLHQLLTFTKAAKAEWTTLRNRSLQIDSFTLESTDAQWVTDTISRVQDELRQTSPNGRVFTDTVLTILEREKNWTRWKNELCPPFDKGAWFAELDDGAGGKKRVGMWEASQSEREKLCADPPEWKHLLGTEPLTEIWEMGYRELADLQRPFQPGEVKDFVKKVKQEDARIELRKKQLTKVAEQRAAARAKAVAAASQPKEEIKPVLPPPTSQESANGVATPVTTSRTLPPATPPLHHPLPAKPGTSPNKSLASSTSQENAQLNAPAAVAAVAPMRVSTPAPAPPAPAPVPEPAPIVLPPDEAITRAEESKQRWSWLALRTARDQYIQQFGKIGTGDIVLLAQEIEKAKEAKEQEERALARGELVPAYSQEEAGLSPMINSSNGGALTEGKADEAHNGGGPTQAPRDDEGDVKMETS